MILLPHWIWNSRGYTRGEERAANLGEGRRERLMFGEDATLQASKFFHERSGWGRRGGAGEQQWQRPHSPCALGLWSAAIASSLRSSLVQKGDYTACHHRQTTQAPATLSTALHRTACRFLRCAATCQGHIRAHPAKVQKCENGSKILYRDSKCENSSR